MFTQNAMRAFRSVVVALLIFAVFPRWCAAQESKVDASVLTALQTQSTVSVSISLGDKPPGKQISDAVKAEFEPGIEAKSAEIRDRIRPFHQRNQALPPNVKAEVRVMHESLDRQTGQMRREIGRRLKNYVAPSQQRVRTAIENAGDTVYAQVALGNRIGAKLSATGVTQISTLDEVERIELDPVIVPNLAGSAPIIYAPRFWDAGYKGGVYDVGIVEKASVEDEHPRLRSKAAGKLIERPPNAGDPTPTQDEIDHATAVAGIVAMIPYRDLEGEHKGIAYGLDTILAATVSTFDALEAAAEWTMTYKSDDPSDDADDADDPSADVVNLSIGPVPRDILGAADYRMDRNDEDHSKYGKRFDALIDCHNILIIKAAGNESKGDTDRYSLGWGADSYNAIVVGASTASGDNQPRAENKVRLSSGRGPTPLKRKKPDVVAPGEGIMTTSPNGGYGSISGTSAAAPHVAGAILLFWDHGLSNPMMQKALLINSAEDRGPAGWDKDWGWGYIDLHTALEQIDYTRSGSIGGGPGYSTDDSIERRRVRWYTGTMKGCQTATLVWHIHDGKPLINLDMYLYSATSHVELDSSLSVKDNVEQVKMPKGHDGTVYIKIVYNVAHHYEPPEKFGLALPSKFTQIVFESIGPPSP